MPYSGESNVPGAPGNLAAFRAALQQGYPGMQQGYPDMQPPRQGGYGPKPFNLDIEGEDDKLKNIGASTTIQLDPNQRLQLGGGFSPASVDEMGMPIPQTYNLRGTYETPGIGINVNWRGGGRRQMGGGFPGVFGAGIQGRW